MDWLFGDDSDSDICTKGGVISQENTSDLSKKNTSTKNQKIGAIVSLLRREVGSVGFAWCGIWIGTNHKGGTKCVACKTEQQGHEGKLDVCIRADGIEPLKSYIIGAGGFNFGGLGMQGQPDGSSVRNIFEGSCWYWPKYKRMEKNHYAGMELNRNRSAVITLTTQWSQIETTMKESSWLCNGLETKRIGRKYWPTLIYTFGDSMKVLVSWV